MFSRRSSRRNFRPGAITGDQMFAAALVFVICSALTLTGYFTCRDTKSKTAGKPQGVWFKCDKCDEEFSLDPSTMSMGEQMGLEQIRMGMQPHAIACQKCSARNKAFEMLQCPNPDCQKRYVPLMFRAPMKQQTDPEKYKDICPHCNMEWAEAHKKARAAKK